MSTGITSSLIVRGERLAASPVVSTLLPSHRERQAHLKDSRSPWSAGASIQHEAMDVTRAAPQGSDYYAEVIYLLP